MALKIICDSAADIGQGEMSGVFVAPMSVSFGNVTYQDGVDLTHDRFYEMLVESDSLPTTGQVTPYGFASASMAPPAPSMLPDSTRWFQVVCERSGAERSPRKPVQIEKAGSPGAWASSAVRETRPTGDSRDAARASEGATGSLSADRYTDRPSGVRQGQHIFRDVPSD